MSITHFPRRGEVSQRILDNARPAYAREPVSKPQASVPKDECPKCGRKLGRGRHFHIKSCKG